MSKVTNKHIQVYEIMKHGGSVNFDAMVKQMGCKPATVMALIFGLRRHAGAEIDTERNGRKVESYKLINAAAIASKMVGKTKSTKTVKPKPTVKAAAKVAVTKTKASSTISKKTKTVDISDGIPTLDVEEIDNDAELASLKAELGLANDFYSE